MPDGMRHRPCGQAVISNESLHGNRKNLEEGKMLKDRIKELREKNNLTISAFARSLNISPTSVSLYESGKQNPGKKTIANIRKVYGVDEAWLTERTTGAETIADTAQADENKTGHRIDKAAVLARAEEAGVRKAAAEFGVTWQTVNKWKKDAEKAAAAALDKVLALMQSPKSPEALMPTPGELDKMFEETFKEMMEEMDAAAEIEASAAEEKTEEKTEEKKETITSPDRDQDSGSDASDDNSSKTRKKKSSGKSSSKSASSKAKSPKTGDESRNLVWMLLAIASASGIMAAVVSRRGRRP